MSDPVITVEYTALRGTWDIIANVYPDPRRVAWLAYKRAERARRSRIAARRRLRRRKHGWR